MTKRTRWLLLAFLVVLVIAVAVVATSGSALDVDTARVGHGTLRETVTAEGRTRVRERYVVAAPVTGRLARVVVEAGDRVEAGGRVARLFPMPEDPRSVEVARARLAAAEARRREATARLQDAEAQAAQFGREVARSRVLARDSVLSRQELEQAELAAASAAQRVGAAEAMLRAAEADVAAARAALVGADPEAAGTPAVDVHAPAAGRVLRVLEESERVVAAGTPLVELGDARRLEVVADVLSEDAVRIAPGDPVVVTGWGGDEALLGRVRLVEPDAFTEVSALGVEEQRVNVVADLEAPPPALGSGYRVEASVVTWQADDVLTVPTSALFQRGGAWQVFAVEDGRAVRRAVRLGHRGDEEAEVLEGLDAGAEVIVFPSGDVEDGVRVRPREP